MKKETATRIEQEIINQIGETVDCGFTVDVGTRDEGSWPYGTKFDVVIFSGIEKKESKKLVKALIELADEGNIGVYSSTKREVLFYAGDLKALFPKSGFLDKTARDSLQDAINSLDDAESFLDNIYGNTKTDKLVGKIAGIRYKLENL